MGIPFSVPQAPDYNSAGNNVMQGFQSAGSALGSMYEREQAKADEQRRYERDQKLHPDVQYGVQALLARMQAGQMSPQEAAAHAKLLVSGQHPSPQDHLPPGSPLLQAGTPGGYNPPDFSGGAGPMPEQPNYAMLPGGAPAQEAPVTASAPPAPPSRGPLPGYTANDLKAVQGMASADYMSQRPELYREKNAVTQEVAQGKATQEATKETGRNTRAGERTVEKKDEFAKTLQYKYDALAVQRDKANKLLILANQRGDSSAVQALKGLMQHQDLLIKQKGMLTAEVQRMGGLVSPTIQAQMNNTDAAIADGENILQSTQIRLMGIGGVPTLPVRGGAPQVQQGQGSGPKTEYSPSRNQTRTTYPDGRVEVKNGRPGGR